MRETQRDVFRGAERVGLTLAEDSIGTNAMGAALAADQAGDSLDRARGDLLPRSEAPKIRDERDVLAVRERRA